MGVCDRSVCKYTILTLLSGQLRWNHPRRGIKEAHALAGRGCIHSSKSNDFMN
jgi:hypothetical protein